jgi:hypothetical protein
VFYLLTRDPVVSSSQSPPAKRVLFIPQGSPTEKATTASPPNSAGRLSSTINESQCTTCSRSVSPDRPCAAKLHPRQATDTKVPSGLEETVRSIMLELFPVMLASFIDRSPSISASLSPSSIESSTHSTSATSLKSIRRLRSLLTARVAAYAERRLHAICEDIEYDANCLRQTADEEFLAIVAEEKLDIEQRQQNALEDWMREFKGLSTRSWMSWMTRLMDWLSRQSRGWRMRSMQRLRSI